MFLICQRVLGGYACPVFGGSTSIQVQSMKLGESSQNQSWHIKMDTKKLNFHPQQ